MLYIMYIYTAGQWQLWVLKLDLVDSMYFPPLYSAPSLM